MSKRFKGRSAIACRTCHASKIKCSGDRGRECIYPIKDRLLTVSEGYIRGLEAQASQVQNAVYPPEHPQTSQPKHPQGLASVANKGFDVPRLADDCSAERFVQKVKDLSSLTAASEQPLGISPAPTSPTARRYTYAKLNFDCIHSEVSVKLPPRPYAFHLLEVFEEGYCDYHWFLRKQFRDQLALTYADPQSQAVDRNWLCRVSVVLALAETWNRGRSFNSSLTSPSQAQTGLRADTVPGWTVPEVLEESHLAPPGSEFFEQCLLLLKMSLEEPVVEDVEALNLITFYSYSLNRRKTAFFYARQSFSLAKLLLLDKPTSSTLEPEERVQDEHRKRIWWTCYCMDRMVSTELGIPPMEAAVSNGLQYPDSGHLLPHERDEFFEPYLLTAQVELSIIKSKVVDVVTNDLRLTDDADPTDALNPCAFLIQSWRNSLPESLSFPFDHGIQSTMLELPFHRVLASLYLRYHHSIILLFRPLLLQELAATIRKNALNEQEVVSTPVPNNDALTIMKLECLSAARYNCRILVDLWKEDVDFAAQQLQFAAEKWNETDIGVIFEWVPLAKDATFVLVHGGDEQGTLAQAFFPNANDLNYLYVHTLAFEKAWKEHMWRVFMHELGHVLGLRHEFALLEGHGAVEVGPRNALSIMNYREEPPEMQQTDIDSTRVFYALVADANGKPPKVGMTRVKDYVPM
ncbi:Nn.00g090900.m01.CDS01 [Neocucurbitaria sp. VM-36]